MKKSLKTIGIIVFTIVLLISVTAYFYPSYLINTLLPKKVKVSAKNTTITETNISLDVQLILDESKMITYLADTLKYEIYLDNSLLIKGMYNVDSGILNGDKDTLIIPIIINRKTIASKAGKFNSGDSTDLKLIITNHVKLPIWGSEKFTLEKDIRIAAPVPPEIKVVHVTKKKLTLKDAVYQLDLEIYNPNYFETELITTDVFIDIKNLFTGNARSLKPIKILAQGKSKISINIDVDDLNLIGDGLKILFKPNKEWDYLLVAKVMVAHKNIEPTELVVKVIGKTKLLGLK